MPLLASASPTAPIVLRVRTFTPPTDEELRQATKKSSNGKTGGALRMRTEDLKEWPRNAKDEEKARRKGELGYKGAGDQ